jgi:hypothetical protein
MDGVGKSNHQVRQTDSPASVTGLKVTAKPVKAASVTTAKVEVARAKWRPQTAMSNPLTFKENAILLNYYKNAKGVKGKMAFNRFKQTLSKWTGVPIKTLDKIARGKILIANTKPDKS